MKPDKFLFGSAFVICLIFLMGMVAATQFIAVKLAYQAQLGPPLAIVKEIPIYNPFRFITWSFHFYAYAPKIFDKALMFPCLASLLGVGAAVFIALKRTQKKESASSHGTASWADQEALKKAGLLEGKGVVLGVSKAGEYLRHDGPEHILGMAPTRSGKGVSIIIPTLLTWPHSVVVTDIKGENWGITSGYRKEKLGNKVLKFDPTDATGKSARFNPLGEIRLGTLLEVKDTQNIADILVDPQGSGQQDHWAKTGHALLVGTILHVLYSKEIKQKNLTAVAAFLSDPSRDIEQTLNAMLTAVHDPAYEFKWLDMGGNPTSTHPVVASAARELLNKSENEKSGVLSTAMSFLGLYRDPVVSANTKESDFKITDLMNHEKPLSLYLVVPPSDLSRTRPLMRMIINQIGRTLTESMEFEDGKPVVTYKHRLLLLLDEFPALGRLDFFESALAFIAGYGMKALLIIQSMNQLKKAYGPNTSIMDNCHIRTVFTPNDPDTADLISKMLGQKTELITNQSYSGNRLNLWLKNTSYSTQETGRALMTPGEVSVLPYEEEIIFIAGIPPIHANKLFYFKDSNFTSRLLSAPDSSDCVTIKKNAAAEADAPVNDTGISPVTIGIAAAAAGIATSIATSGEILKNREPDITTTGAVTDSVEPAAELAAIEEEEAAEEEAADYLSSMLLMAQNSTEEEENEPDHDNGGLSL